MLFGRRSYSDNPTQEETLQSQTESEAAILKPVKTPRVAEVNESTSGSVSNRPWKEASLEDLVAAQNRTTHAVRSLAVFFFVSVCTSGAGAVFWFSGICFQSGLG
jgi:hypothetical protein